jgi:hypothetical protein
MVGLLNIFVVPRDKIFMVGLLSMLSQTKEAEPKSVKKCLKKV